MRVSRRDFLKFSGVAAGATVIGPGQLLPGVAGVRSSSFFVPAAAGLSDPAQQPKFANLVPNAMDPTFAFKPFNKKKQKYRIAAGAGMQMTGLVNAMGSPLATPIFGYGSPALGYTWPSRTIQARTGEPIEVTWENRLVDSMSGSYLPHLLPVDTSLHWAYSLPGYTQYSIANSGIPIVTHVHGGHSDSSFDGNPEFFFSPGWMVKGPQWVEKKYTYHNDQPAGTLWFHDHALGITRLNVYAGMAGFYILRDEFDTGMSDNPLGLPAFPYEAAFAIQDRMFRATGELFYSAFPGDPFYDDFITGEGAVLPPEIFPGGGPTALAEFFGDHMLVNGMIWPKFDVEPRNYRMRLLNGCDSRFLVVQFRAAASPTATDLTGAGPPLPFWIIGSDQGLAEAATQVDTLVIEPGGRYDVVVDFSQVPWGSRIILANIAGDAPFGGDYGSNLPPEEFFPDRQTDRIMAFDVVLPEDTAVPDNFNPTAIDFGPDVPPPTRTRKVALFEGTDEFGRLQPLLGTAEPATDYAGNSINWPATPGYASAGLVGPMEGSIGWHSPTTENPALGSTEEWEIWNVTGDAHPVHLHLVNFEVIGRNEIMWDSATTEEERDLDPGEMPSGDGTYLVDQLVVQHNGLLGHGYRIVNPTKGAAVLGPVEYVENAPKDMVTALPNQVTRIKATFDKPGRYVWHCHILSHEDHEMMRVLHVGPGA